MSSCGKSDFMRIAKKIKNYEGRSWKGAQLEARRRLQHGGNGKTLEMLKQEAKRKEQEFDEKEKEIKEVNRKVSILNINRFSKIIEAIILIKIGLISFTSIVFIFRYLRYISIENS